MVHWNMATNRTLLPNPCSLGPLATAAVLMAAAIPVFLIASFVPLSLLMPVLSLVSFLAAGAVALFAYYSRADRRAAGITSWDVAGVFALIWITTGMLSEPQHVIQLFDHIAMVQ